MVFPSGTVFPSKGLDRPPQCPHQQLILFLLESLISMPKISYFTNLSLSWSNSKVCNTVTSIHSTVKSIYDVLAAVFIGTVTPDLIDPTQLSVLSWIYSNKELQPLFPPSDVQFYYTFLDATLTRTSVNVHIPFEFFLPISLSFLITPPTSRPISIPLHFASFIQPMYHSLGT